MAKPKTPKARQNVSAGVQFAEERSVATETENEK
jgi:hypothetical protein